MNNAQRHIRHTFDKALRLEETKARGATLRLLVILSVIVAVILATVGVFA